MATMERAQPPSPRPSPVGGEFPEAYARALNPRICEAPESSPSPPVEERVGGRRPFPYSGSWGVRTFQSLVARPGSLKVCPSWNLRRSVRHMALGAQSARLGPGFRVRFRLAVMRSADDLLMPLRPGWIGLVTAQASPVVALVDLHLRIVAMRLAGTMAAFAREGFVLVLLHLLNFIRMAFFTCLFPRKDRFARAEFRKGCRPKPSILAEGWRRQKV